MSINLSTLARNIAGKCLTDLIDQGSVLSNGYMELRTGSKPDTPQVAATGTLLATLQFSNPAYGAWTNGMAIANAIAQDDNIAVTGQVGWFRIYDRDSNALFDGDVTVTDGAGDIEFDDINFIIGGTIIILSLNATMPQ